MVSTPSIPATPEMPEVKEPAPLATKVAEPETIMANMRAGAISQSKKKGRATTIASGNQTNETTAGNTRKKNSRAYNIANAYTPLEAEEDLYARSLLGE